MRTPEDPPDAPASHVLVIATLAAPQRRGLSRRTQRKAQPEPEPTPVTTGRATVVDVGAPLADERQASTWLAGAGEEDLAADLVVLNRALHSFRLVTADAYQNPVTRAQMLVARVGYGGGEQVADGLWTAARELLGSRPRQRRAKVLQPQARLAAVLGGHDRALVCEELVLRGRLDLDQGRDREAALQVLVALDAALAELAVDPAAPALQERIAELRRQREAVAAAAQQALAAPLEQPHRDAVAFTLGRIEAALRARALANA